MSQQSDIAIIGMSCLFPDASSPEDLYQNLRSKRDSIKPPSDERVKYASLDPLHSYLPGGYLHRIDCFDHKFFNISKKEADYMEPSQRLSMELACKAIENAGYSLSGFQDSETALYMALNQGMASMYQLVVSSTVEDKNPMIHTGTLASMLVGRLAYYLKTKGPAMLIDTGCSSALVALYEASEKVRSGLVDYAIVGGMALKPHINRADNPGGHLGASSIDSRCRAFDEDANGIGMGEGGGMVLIKRLDRAEEDGDHVLAVLKGMGIRQDGGRANSLAAPSPQAQVEAILSAWEASGVPADTITYVEGHGAGTHLGDVIEVQALNEAFRKRADRHNSCAIGSIKTNIGHLGNAAGLAGLIKAVLSIKHKVVFPNLHFNKPNPFIDFDNGSVYVNTQLKTWDASDGVRRCGVSSFGLSGTNVHLVLEEKPAEESAAENDSPLFVKVSAKSPDQLLTYVKEVANALKQDLQQFRNKLYTLNTGRDDYKYRMAAFGGTDVALIRQLEEYHQVDDKAVVTQDGKEVVLLFSGNGWDKTFTEKLSHSYPVFRAAWQSVLEKSNDPNAQVEYLAAAWAFYQLLVSWGVAIKTVIGTGLGKSVTQIVTGKKNLDEAIATLEKGEIEQVPLNEKKVKELCKKLGGRKSPLFVEMGSGGELYEKVGALSQRFKLTMLPLLSTSEYYPALQMMRDIYQAGGTINWQKMFDPARHQRVEVPTYPFEKIRCWYEEPNEGDIDRLSSSLYQLSWKQSPSADECKGWKDETLLMIKDNHGLADALEEQLAQDNQCVIVSYGEYFTKQNAFRYILNPSIPEDFQALHQALADDQVIITGIINCSAYQAPYALTIENHQHYFNSMVESQYVLAKAFHSSLEKSGFIYAAVSSNAYRVTDTDTVVLPLHYMGAVLLKGLMTEYPGLMTAHTDISFQDNNLETIAKEVYAEISVDNSVRFSALRNNRRYIPNLVRNTRKLDREKLDGLFSQEGIYLITGGSSGIGLEIARMMACPHARLVITGRSVLPDPSQWKTVLKDKQHPSYERVKALDDLQQLGAEVTYYAAAVEDVEKMSGLFASLKKRYSKITGVIHSAGQGNSGISLVDRNFEEAKATFGPKVTGTILLNELAESLHPDFMVCFSSIGVLVPTRGGTDYAVANSFLDSFAHAAQANHRQVIAINWSDWKETGLAHRKRLKLGEEITQMREQLIQGINNKEGVMAFRMAAYLKAPQIAVAKIDLSDFAANPYFSIDPSALKTEATEISRLVTDSAEELDIDQVEKSTDRALTNTQKKLLAIWYEVLMKEDIDLDEDFYEAGGHSLNIAQMLNKIKKHFQVELGFEQMIEFNTVRKLAEKIDTHVEQCLTTAYEEIPQAPKQEDYALSHAQKRFWIQNQRKGKEANNVPAAFIFTGKVNADVLEKAISQVIERHESLRTAMINANGEPRQKVRGVGEYEFKLDREDLGANQEVIRERVREESGKAFDLAEVPLIKARLFTLAENKYVFLMIMHHIVVDAKSVAIVREEIMTTYQSIVNETSSGLAPLNIQYKDYAAWQNRKLSSGGFAKHQDYWRARLSGTSSIINLPRDHDHKVADPTLSETLRFTLDKPTLEKLRKLAGSYNASLFTVVMALVKILLSRYSQQSDIVVATPVSGRDHPDLENQVGVYLNTLLLKTTIAPKESFRNLVIQIRENTLADLEHQQYPFDKLVTNLSQGAPNRPEIFNVGFTWTIRHTLPENGSLDFEIADFPTGFSRVKSDLWIYGAEYEDSLSIGFNYRLSMFKRATIALMTERFKMLVNSVLDYPNQTIESIDFRPIDEKKLEAQTVSIEFDF